MPGLRLYVCGVCAIQNSEKLEKLPLFELQFQSATRTAQPAPARATRPVNVGLQVISFPTKSSGFFLAEVRRLSKGGCKQSDVGAGGGVNGEIRTKVPQISAYQQLRSSWLQTLIIVGDAEWVK